MSAHPLPVTVAWLVRLPSGVVLSGSPEEQIERGAWLDLSDTLTAAAVAARIIWPWLSADREHRAAHRDVEHVIRAAERMQPLTPADIDILTRLARAAMEGA